MAGNWHYNYVAMAGFRAKMEKELEDRLEKAATYAETAVKMALSQPGGGHLYGSHRSSAPGQPPTVWTGQLRGSITHQLVRTGHFLQAIVGTNVLYAILLEYGTSKMAPRPFLRVTIDKIQSQLWGIMAGGEGNE